MNGHVTARSGAWPPGFVAGFYSGERVPFITKVTPQTPTINGSRLGSLYYSGSDVCPQNEKIGFVLGFHPCFILVRASFGRGWPDRNSQKPYPRSLALPRKCDITRNPEVCSFLQKRIAGESYVPPRRAPQHTPILAQPACPTTPLLVPPTWPYLLVPAKRGGGGGPKCWGSCQFGGHGHARNARLRVPRHRSFMKLGKFRRDLNAKESRSTRAT